MSRMSYPHGRISRSVVGVSATLKESGAACDDAAQTATPARPAATIMRREIEILMVVSLDCIPQLKA
jgi:hypothetical protein